ncbi:SaV-like [uncultured Caudovirales phage]|uniref:SaV-like n=1 Tax=uncultured Caudovirales phage TaxID=2100421 RepID=A0A6J5P2S3_9CAUD|nr:SaV-like [uncultured Caudovirales phage]
MKPSSPIRGQTAGLVVIDDVFDRTQPQPWEGPVRPVPAQSDAVFKPKHYTQWKIEPITFICDNNVPFCEANVIKYVMRHRAKNGAEDIRKAIRYCEMILERDYAPKA